MNKTIEYKVLARKYRPKKFSDLIGQNILVEILTNAILNDRIAHAYILNGVRGVGKTTTARIISMSLNCQNKTKDDCEPCGSCQSCNSIINDNNLDVIEMDAASNTGVDDVREIIDNVKYKPINSSYKIFIIDEVHMLSRSAFNALLKTLEEPPEHVKFIFATTEIKKIPVTVLSRCQRFDLHRIDNKILAEYLNKICKNEKIEINKDAISLIIRSADGSARDALSLLDQAITNRENEITYESIIQMLGLADRDKIFSLMENIFEGKATETLIIYKNLYDLGADINMIFDEMLNVVHFLTQIKIAPNIKDDISIPENERLRGFELSSKLTINNLSIIWQILFKGYQEIQNGTHLYQLGEMIILRVIYFYDGQNPDDLIKKINEEDKTDKTNNLQINQKTNILNNNTLNADIKHSKSHEKKDLKIDSSKVHNYRNFVELFFKNREGLLHTKLYNDVILISFKEGEIVLNTEKISDLDFNKKVAKLISKWTGRIWQVHSSTSNIGRTLNEEDTIKQQIQIEEMKNHPQIKKILSEFSGSKIHSITEVSELSDNEEKFSNKKIKEQ